MNNFIKIISLPLISISLFGCNFSNAYEAKGINQYDKAEIVNKYHSSLDSNLSLFPDEIKSIKEESFYYAYVSNEFFDKNPKIILECQYDKETFDQEIERIKNGEITITYKNESVTNKVIYDEEMYIEPAYIAIDGFADKYEYALINYEDYIIAYVYFAYPGESEFQNYQSLVKKDKSLYDKTSLKSFTIYAHSFDGGKSFIEFDD